MYRNGKLFITVCVSLSMLSSCALFSPLAQKNPGSRFAVTCDSDDVLGQRKCDIDAKDFCENPPVGTRTMTESRGGKSVYTSWYYCP